MVSFADCRSCLFSAEVLAGGSKAATDAFSRQIAEARMVGR